MTATALWAAVVASYNTQSLIDLTRINDQSASTINTTVGESAAQAVIDLWPIYAQTTFDASDATHLEVGKHATIAVLFRRGASTTQVAKVEWEEVFSDDGMIARVKKTGPRGRGSISTNSGVQQRAETMDGSPVISWGDRDAIPHGILPRRRAWRDDD